MHALEFAIFLSRRSALSETTLNRARRHARRFPIGIIDLDSGATKTEFTVSYHLREANVVDFVVWDRDEQVIDCLKVDLASTVSDVMDSLNIIGGMPVSTAGG